MVLGKVCPIFGHSLFFCCRPCPPDRPCRLLQGDFQGHGLPSFFKPCPKLLQTLPGYRIFNDAGIRKAVLTAVVGQVAIGVVRKGLRGLIPVSVNQLTNPLKHQFRENPVLFWRNFLDLFQLCFEH